MSRPQKKPGWAFWATIVLVVVLAYPLSVGPACRLLHWAGTPDRARVAYNTFYAPIFWVHENGPKPIRDLIYWYCWAGVF